MANRDDRSRPLKSKVRRLTRGLAAMPILLLVAGLAQLVAPSAQTLPPTLTGEVFTGTPTVTASCNPSGTSTIAFTVSGIATGPYPGTFTETGSATLPGAPPPSTPAPVQSFSASFTIFSGTTTVIGTKTLISNPFIATGLGFCTDALESFGVAFSYQATIATPTGVFADKGQGGTALNAGTSFPTPTFNEFFSSSLFQVVPILSTVACTADITQGGWMIANNGHKVTFGGTAFSDNNGAPSGQEQYTDSPANLNVHSIDIVALVCTSERADIYGHATENGSGNHFFRIEVTDPDSTAGADTYWILLDNYDSGSHPLGGGTVEIHTT